MEKMKNKNKFNLSKQRTADKAKYMVDKARAIGLHHKAEAMQCTWDMIESSKTATAQWEDDHMWSDHSYETQWSTLLDEKKYREYVMNPKDRNAKPWILMMTYHPQSYHSHVFQTYSIMFNQVICTGKALGYNVGFIDINKDENLKEMFTYWYSGGYGLGVPYYVVVPNDGNFYHL